LHSRPQSSATQAHYAQFFTPADVALYAAYTLLEGYEGEPVFDPCMGHGGLLIAAAIVLFVRYKLRGVSLLDRLHGSEIDPATAKHGLHNLANALALLCPEWSAPAILQRLRPHITITDFHAVPPTSFQGHRLIANPPYRESSQGNTWIPLVLHMLQASLTGLSMIVPVAVTSSRRAQAVRTQLWERFGRIQALHHEIRPRPLFPRVEQRISIITAHLSDVPLYVTTGFLRHRTRERLAVWQASMTSLPQELCLDQLPKVAPDDLGFYTSCIHRVHRVSVAEYRAAHPVNQTGVPLWIRSTGRYHLSAQLTPPAALTTKWHRIVVPSPLAAPLLTAFASGDVLRWWQIFGDGRDLSLQTLLQRYGIPLPAS
jgi:hypothetical protein